MSSASVRVEIDGEKKAEAGRRIRRSPWIFILTGLMIAGGFFFPSKGVSAGAFSIAGDDTIIDQAGRKIPVSRPFSRILSLYGAHTENLFALNLSEEIIGVSRNEVYPPEAAKKPAFSYREDPEKFLVARPDLVLIRPMIDRAYPRLIQRLEQCGITVVSLQPGDVPQMYTYWEILGVLTGRKAAARKMIRNFKAQVNRIRAVTVPIPSKQKIYFEAIHRQMKTFAPDAMAVFALETAGGVNVAADAVPVRNTNIAFYGKERILSKGDEIDAFIAQSGAMNRPSQEMIRNEPGFSAVKAVREGRILIVPEEIVSRPTPRLLEGIHVIGRFLYPEIFNTLDMEKGGTH